MSNKNSKIVGLDLSTKSIKYHLNNIKYLNLINTNMDNIRKIKRLKNYQFDLIHTYSIYYSNKPSNLLHF